MDAAPRSLESRCQLILRQRPGPIPVRLDQCIAHNSFCTFPCKPESRRLLVEQFTPPHHAEMFRPLHCELYVTQPGCFKIIVSILNFRRIHGFRQPFESVGSQFGQQAGDVPEVVSRGAMGNACLPRTRAQRKTLQAGVPYDLLRGFQQGRTKVSVMISITFAYCRGFGSRCVAYD